MSPELKEKHLDALKIHYFQKQTLDKVQLIRGINEVSLDKDGSNYVDDFLLYGFFVIQTIDERPMHVCFDTESQQFKLKSGERNGYCIFRATLHDDTENYDFAL